MKTVKDVDAKPLPFEDDIPAEAMARIPTFRKMYVAAVGMMINANGDKAIDLYQLGLKLKTTDADIVLEDSQFSMLKDSCNSNPMQWIAHYHAQAMIKLKEAEGK